MPVVRERRAVDGDRGPRVVDDASAVAAILELVDRARAAWPIVLVDGRSGAGKSTVADRLIEAWPGAQLVRLDDLTPGWDGLDAAAAQVVDLLRSDPPMWRAWDWAREAPGPWHRLDRDRPLVVEGAGALSRAARALATVGVWIDLPDDAERRRRALERDGETYRPHWDRWAEQEVRFAARERPRDAADLIVRRG